MPKSENLTNCPRCQHIKDDNVRCGSPAVHGKSLCYFHDRQRQTFPNRRRRRPAQFSRRADFFNVRTPDDVMRAINQVLNAVLNGQLSNGEASSILFALQTASLLAPHTTAAKKQRMSMVPHVSPVPHVPVAQRPNVGPFLPPTLPQIPPNWPPKTVDELFEMFPGCEDLKAMLTPEEVALLDSAASRRD